MARQHEDLAGLEPDGADEDAADFYYRTGRAHVVGRDPPRGADKAQLLESATRFMTLMEQRYATRRV